MTVTPRRASSSNAAATVSRGPPAADDRFDPNAIKIIRWPFRARILGIERALLYAGNLTDFDFERRTLMLFYPQERIALFVDGANLYGAAKGLAFDIDYKRLLELFARKGLLVRAFYYTALAEDQEFSPLS